MRDKSHFSLSAADYEVARSGHLAQRRLALVEAALRRHPAEVRHALEIGFGSGNILAELAARYPRTLFSGTEIEEKMVAYARERYARPNVEYLLTDLTEHRLTRRYDFVYSVDVLHHIHEPLPFLNAVRDAMNDGARWLIIEPNIYHPYIYYQQDRMRRQGLDEDQFRPWAFAPLFRANGFTIHARRYAFLFPGFIKQLPRSLHRLERRLERRRLFGGSVLYLLAARSVTAPAAGRRGGSQRPPRPCAH